MTPLEKAARALWIARELMQPERCRMRWEDGTPLARETAVVQARAVLLAIREPGDTVGWVGAAIIQGPVGGSAKDAATDCFAGMVDAILGPDE